jgi:hypothetical protein
MVLSPGQKKALTNLLDKKAGADVGFINISDATALVDLGLAIRGAAGWTVTPAGESMAAMART